MKSKLLSLPYIFWLIIFILIPTFLVVIFAFIDENYNFTTKWIIESGNYIGILFKSIYFAIISTLICFIIAFPIAFILSRSKKYIQKTLLMLIILPMWMNLLLRTYAWMTLLENNGIINQFLNFIGLGKINIINTPYAIILGMVYNYLPFMILPLYSVMTKIEKSIIEAAQDLGANYFVILCKILLPLSLSGIVAGITMVFVPSVSTFIISRMLGGGGNLLFGDIIEQQFIGSTYNPYMGSAMSLFLMIIILIIMWITNMIDKNKEDRQGMLL
ncbi:MAG: ABC transporter permease [Oscillospiraceae bacterium]|nr:ABC transporter permease [Oscillospiraceae bacterium]